MAFFESQKYVIDETSPSNATFAETWQKDTKYEILSKCMDPSILRAEKENAPAEQSEQAAPNAAMQAKHAKQQRELEALAAALSVK